MSKKWQTITDHGQCYVEINPQVFASAFKERMNHLAGNLRNHPQSDEGTPILIPGDPERSHIENCNLANGISYVPILIKSMHHFAIGNLKKNSNIFLNLKTKKEKLTQKSFNTYKYNKKLRKKLHVIKLYFYLFI